MHTQLANVNNKIWITKSACPYAAPVVCVRKKDGNLRLYIDYRLLNKKTVADRHPLHRIQDLMDTPGGNAWFSILDQGKAYHQGFIAESSHKFTAFITPWGHWGSQMPQLHSSAAWKRCLDPSEMNVVFHI